MTYTIYLKSRREEPPQAHIVARNSPSSLVDNRSRTHTFFSHVRAARETERIISQSRYLRRNFVVITATIVITTRRERRRLTITPAAATDDADDWTTRARRIPPLNEQQCNRYRRYYLAVACPAELQEGRPGGVIAIPILLSRRESAALRVFSLARVPRAYPRRYARDSAGVQRPLEYFNTDVQLGITTSLDSSPPRGTRSYPWCDSVRR